MAVGGVIEERQVTAYDHDARGIVRAYVVTSDKERQEGHEHDKVSYDVGLKKFQRSAPARISERASR